MIGRRLLQAIPTLVGASLVVFVIVRLTGDPASVMLPPDATPEAVAQFRQRYGLDQPLVVQYLTFLKNALTGDLGNSIRYSSPVSELILERFPATVDLAVAAILFATILGVGFGIVGGLKPNSVIDYFGRALALMTLSVPTFFLGVLLVLVFGVLLRWLPTSGTGSMQHLILPGITLGALMLPLVLRTARGAVLDVSGRDYMRTVRAKGLPESRVVGVHIMRNAMVPITTVIGLEVGMVLGGAVVTETVFAWPGMGLLLVNAITTRDFPVVQGVVLFTAVIFVLLNLVVDVIYRIIDPRIRQQ